jgi:hypothetical protein
VQVAVNLLQQGGVATTGVVSGGRIVKVRMEHAWVQAYSNWTPSRGNRNATESQHPNPNGPLNAWVDIDPSYKQYTFSSPLSFEAAVPLDAVAVRNAIANSATVSPAGYVAGLNESAIADQVRGYGARVQSFLDSRPELQLSDLVKTRQIVPDMKQMLAGVLPHRAISAQVLPALPPALRHMVSIKLFASELDRSENSPMLNYRISIAALNYRRMGANYEPASSADAQVMSNAVASGATSLPAYLINVRPTLKIDGQAVASANAVRMASDQYWTVGFEDPSGFNSSNANFDNSAGDEIVFGLNSNGITADLIAKRYVEGAPETASGNLEQAALRYWLEHDLFDRMAADSAKVMTMRMPSAIEFSAPLTTSYFFGIARTASYKSLSGDGQRVLMAVAGQTASTERNFLLMAGLQGSAIEGSVLDQLFSRPDETSVSTTQFFAIAVRQGLKLYSVTADNIAAVLPQLAISQGVKDDIASMVSAGGVAFVPEREVLNKGYAGIGYMLLNPQTGEGAYLIDGGRNGLNMPLCEGSAQAPGSEISVQSLFSVDKLAVALFVPPSAGATAAEQKAWVDMTKELARITKPAAETIAKRLGPRMLAAYFIPGVNIALGVALAVEISMILMMVVVELKLMMAELEIQTMLRTDEDTACKCKKTPDDPSCPCTKTPIPHKPSRSTAPKSEWNVYNRRVDYHHTCADNTGNSYPDQDVVIYSPKLGERKAMDLFNNGQNLACEVKTSFKNQPYDSYVLNRWLNSTLAQVKAQQKITAACKWNHCVIVNKPWMYDAIQGAAAKADLQVNVRLIPTCGSAVEPEPEEQEFPFTPLDTD